MILNLLPLLILAQHLHRQELVHIVRVGNQRHLLTRVGRQRVHAHQVGQTHTLGQFLQMVAVLQNCKKKFMGFKRKMKTKPFGTS